MNQTSGHTVSLSNNNNDRACANWKLFKQKKLIFCCKNLYFAFKSAKTCYEVEKKSLCTVK